MQTKFTEIANKITTIKSGFAEAISAKGVETAPNAPFSTMIENIGNIASGESESETEEWIKPHDWIDIEAEPLETGEIRVLMCDVFGADNNTIYFARRSGATNIKATIDWGDGTQEEVNVSNANTTVNHDFVGGGVYCDRGYNQYVVRIRFNEPTSAPQQMYFYRNDTTSTINKHNNILWIYGDMQYFTSLATLTCGSNSNSCSILLERANLIYTNNVKNMDSAFRYCRSLRSIPQLDTSNITNANYLFQLCTSLKNTPLLDLGKLTSMTYMFSDCTSLETVSISNTDSLTTMNFTFQNCTSLRELSQIDMSNVTQMNYAFYNCYSLKSIPPSLNTSKCTQMNNIFSGCKNLLKTPPLDTRKAIGNTSYNSNHFGGCSNLTEIGTVTLSKDIQLVLNTSKCLLTKIDLAFDESDVPIFTQTVPIKINYTQLSAESLNKVMTQLPDGNGKTLDLKYNAGSLGCDPSIATAKNWTVLLK